MNKLECVIITIILIVVSIFVVNNTKGVEPSIKEFNTATANEYISVKYDYDFSYSLTHNEDAYSCSVTNISEFPLKDIKLVFTFYGTNINKTISYLEVGQKIEFQLEQEYKKNSGGFNLIEQSGRIIR